MKLPLSSLTRAALLAALATTAAGADYPTTVTAQAPLAYYRLNETTPPPPLSLAAVNIGSVGAAGNGEFRNGVERGVAGAIVSDPANTAVRMPDQEGNRVRVPWDAAWNPTSPFSVEFWAKPGQTNALQCPAASVEFIASPTQRNGWLFYQGDTTLTGGNGWIFRQYNNSSLTAQSGAAATMDLQVGQWYHVVGVFEGARIKLYVNGQLMANSAFNNTPRPISNSAIPLTFGARADGVSGYFTYNGSVDESAVYNTALSADQVLAHYQAGIAPAPATPYRQVVLADAPVGYWRLGEPADAVAANAGTLGSSANAKIIAPTAVAVTGPTGTGFEADNKAFEFTTGGYVQAPALNINNNAMTITCWVKPNGDQTNHAGIVFQRARLATGASGSTAGLKMDALGGLKLSYNWDGDNATYNWDSGVSLNAGEWNFVALIVQPKKAILFTPGGVIADPVTREGEDINHAPLEFEGSTYIGMDPTTDLVNTGRKFVGAIDEVAVFNRALSIGDTYTQYAAAVGNLPPKIFVNPVPPTGTVYAGDSVTLTVDAGGTPDITYQWRKNGSPIGGATGASLTLSGLTSNDAGDYSVTVRNTYGQVTSGAATLFVNSQQLPSFVQNLLVPNRTLFDGGSIKLSVVAEGGALTYQWNKDGFPIPGATSPSLSLNGIVAADAGAYNVTVSNPAGSTDSASTTVTIVKPTDNSYAAAVYTDKPRAWFRMDDPVSSELMLDAMGAYDGRYTTRSGTPVTLGSQGALVGDPNTAASFSLADQAWGETYPPPVAMGDYTFECWVRTSNTADTISPLSSFRSQYGLALWYDGTNWRSGDGYGDLDGTVQIRFSAVGGARPGQWLHFAITYSGATAHRTYVNGVWDGSAYVDHSRNRNVPMRVGATLRPGNEWFFAGDIDEVAVYNKALTQDRILAHYQAGLFGTTTKPFFIREPATQIVLPSTSVTFNGQADGSYPITYQWFKNGTAIANATNANYTVTASATPSGPDAYQLRASNSAGDSFTRAANLTVLAPNPTSWDATAGCVLHLKFDGDYKDASGRGNNGSPSGAPELVSGILGQALRFNTDTAAGSFNYVTLGSPADLSFGTNVDFSVSYWVRTTNGALTGDLPFLCSAVNAYGNAGLTFAPSYNLGGWSFSLNGVAQVYGANNSINNGQWHHLLHAFNRKGDVVTYLDGVQVDSRSVTSAGNADSGQIFNIGQDPTGAYAESGGADLDDLAVWRRYLTVYDAYAINYVARTYGQSFDPTILAIGLVGGGVQISWAGAGTLQQAPAVTGPWTPLPAATSPYTVAPSGAGSYFRVQK